MLLMQLMKRLSDEKDDRRRCRSSSLAASFIFSSKNTHQARRTFVPTTFQSFVFRLRPRVFSLSRAFPDYLSRGTTSKLEKVSTSNGDHKRKVCYPGCTPIFTTKIDFRLGCDGTGVPRSETQMEKVFL